ncbi:hypothetical protein CSUI_007562 [Cystoisospora suis]|uniref:Uncharacterized protein n=1 Tax=Cystoisospora suis TaxID=483139 RepID=A0A2C6KQ65_9APIC|nr:hypothetical protein CSUI_007562 [Cystoisospora suis]
MVSFSQRDTADNPALGERVPSRCSSPAPSARNEPGPEPKVSSSDGKTGTGICMAVRGLSTPSFPSSYTTLSSPSGVSCSAPGTLHHPQPDQASLLELMEPRCLFHLFSFFDVSELPVFFFSRHFKQMASHAFGVRQCVSLTLQSRWRWRSKDLALFFTLCKDGGVRLPPESMRLAKTSFGYRVGVGSWAYLFGQGAFLRYISIEASAHPMYSLEEQYSLLGTHSSTLEELRVCSCRRVVNDLADSFLSNSGGMPPWQDSMATPQASDGEMLRELEAAGQVISGDDHNSSSSGRASAGVDVNAASYSYRSQRFPRLRVLSIVGEVLIPYTRLLSSCLEAEAGEGSGPAFPKLETLVLYNPQLGQGDTLELESRIVPLLTRVLPTVRSFVFIGWKCRTGVRALLRLLFVPGPENGALERVRLGCYSAPAITTTRWFELVADHAASLADQAEWNHELELGHGSLVDDQEVAVSSSASPGERRVFMTSGHVSGRSTGRIDVFPDESVQGGREGTVEEACTRARLKAGLERGGISLHCGTNANFRFVVAAVAQLRRLTGNEVVFAVEGYFFISFDDFDLQSVSQLLPTIDIVFLFPSLGREEISTLEDRGRPLHNREGRTRRDDAGVSDVHLVTVPRAEGPGSAMHARSTAMSEGTQRKTALLENACVDKERKPGGGVHVFRRARLLRLHLRDSGGHNVRQATGSQLSASVRHLFVYAPAYQDEVLSWSQSQEPSLLSGRYGSALPTVGLFDEQLGEARHDWPLIVYSRVIPFLSEVEAFVLEAPSGTAGFDFYRRLVPAICALPHLRTKFVGVELTPQKSMQQTSNFSMLLRSLPGGVRPPLRLLRLSFEGVDVDPGLLSTLRTSLAELLGVYVHIGLVEVEQKGPAPGHCRIPPPMSDRGRQGLDELLCPVGFRFGKVVEDEVTLDRVISYSRRRRSRN